MKKVLPLLTCAFMLLLLGSCVRPPAPSRQNYGLEYQNGTTIRHELRVEGDSLHVYLLYADIGFFERRSNLTVTCTGFLNYEQPDMILKDSVFRNASPIIKTEGGMYVHFKLPKNRLKIPSVLIVKIAARNDPNNALKHDIYLTAKDLSKNYLLQNPQTNLPLFRHYVRINEPFLISQFGVPLPGELKQYETNFSAALPPMAKPETKIAPSLKMKQTFSFLDNIVSLPETGLYGIEIGGKNVGGLLIENASFPELTSAEDLIQPLIYLTTAEERTKLYQAKDPKAAVDKFWLNINANQNEARRLIRTYYERVTDANRFFSAHKAGWQTDRGMIYLIFGPPEEVHRFSDREDWTYNASPDHNEIRFVFLKKENTFTQNHYELIRSIYLEDVWYSTVEQWRKGIIAR